MRPVVTDGVGSVVCLSVCLSVCHDSEPYTKTPLNRSTCRFVWMLTRVGSRDHVSEGVWIPNAKGQLWGGKGQPIVMYRDLLPWAVQKGLNRSRCRLRYAYGLGWAQGSIVLDGVHIGATRRTRLNRLCAAAMRPFVKLLWPLVRWKS